MGELIGAIAAVALTNVVIAQFGTIGLAYALPCFVLMRIWFLVARIWLLLEEIAKGKPNASEIVDAHSLLHDVKHLTNLIAAAGIVIEDGNFNDRDGVLRALELGSSVRVCGRTYHQ